MEKRIKELVLLLNKACDAYYNSGNEIMSNYEYDVLFDELTDLEASTGIILPNSPTQTVGSKADAVDGLEDVVHEFPALSLAKTKNINEFPVIFAQRDNLAMVMWKEDGSTIVATYDEGNLSLLSTRGNGIIGQIITHNAPYIKGLPMHIDYKGHFVVRGEAVMTYEEFERINASLPEDMDKYKNPRNLANASVRLLDSNKLKDRQVNFKAFELVYCENMPATFAENLKLLEDLGFGVVEHQLCSAADLITVMDRFSNSVDSYEFPVDGLVVATNDYQYARSLPGTNHNPHKLAGYAFKWADEMVDTVLTKIEWSASRTGLINPVAVFQPVELEGTTVMRATLHNLSYIEDMQLLPGDTIGVYKANKIIPKVGVNKTVHSSYQLDDIVPFNCPVCAGNIEIKENNGTKTLWCTNPECSAKHVNRFVHFCEKDCMNIKGLSEATIEKFCSLGWLKTFDNLYTLIRDHGETIANMDGFGEKSVANLDKAIEKSRKTDFIRFVDALGIPSIGHGQAKVLSKEFNGNIVQFFDEIVTTTDPGCFTRIEGIGDVLSRNIYEWGKINVSPSYLDNHHWLTKLITFLEFEEMTAPISDILAGKIFVITGDVHIYKNRNELKAKIESLGGKVSGSVSAKTSYLINNDKESTSSKNKAAQVNGTPILSEEDFQSLIGE